MCFDNTESEPNPQTLQFQAHQKPLKLQSVVCKKYKIYKKYLLVLGGGELQGVGVMTDKDLKFEDVETSHNTIGGAGEVGT